MHPAPVHGPDVDGHIVDVRAGVQATRKLQVAVVAAHGAFVARGNHVVGVQALDQGCGLGKHVTEGIRDRRFAGERPGLVGKLPAENGRIVPVKLSGDGVAAGNDVADVVEIHLLGLAVGVELGRLYAPAPHGGTVGRRSPLEVDIEAAAPAPGVAQEKHGLHVALAELCKEIVESDQERVVIDSRFGLQDGRGAGGHILRPVRPDQDAKVGDAKRFELVELADEPVAVASTAFGTQDRPVPHVRSDECNFLAVPLEAAVDNLCETAAGTVGTGRHRKDDGCGRHQRFQMLHDRNLTIKWLSQRH